MATHCRRYSVLRFLSVISLFGAVACGGDETCGPPAGTPTDGVTLTIDGMAATFGMFTSSPNNDCSMTSLSVHGQQVTPTPSTPFFLTLCFPAPEQLGKSNSLAEAARIVLQDVQAELAGCTYTRDSAQAPAGTLELGGYCSGGRDPAGYALTFDGSVAGLKTCGMMAPVPVTMQLSGSASVAAI